MIVLQIINRTEMTHKANMNDHNLVLSKSNSWQMFDQISAKYDFLNHILSFGLDILWRKKISQYLKFHHNQSVLDLATGTADVLISLIKQNPHVTKTYGIDLADKMLDVGREKILKRKMEDRIHLKHGDANNIPFKNNTFDCTTMAFGIRNVDDPNQVLSEMHRVLNENGRTLILEFSLPQNKILRTLHLFYLRTIVPIIGGLVSGHYKAYKYLNQSIERFPYGQSFCALMAAQGFKNIEAHPLLGGIATIYQGDKSAK